MADDDRVTYFGETDYRNKRTPFGIKAIDRTRHVYVIGKTGMGKSTVLENMAVQDIQNGEGTGFIDPHGSTAEKLLDYVPEHRIKDVVYFAPFDIEYPISFNVMEDVGADKRHLVVSGLMSSFKKIWVDAWSARMEYILTNILLALLEYPDSTLLGVNRMLADKEYRKKVVENVSDPSVRSFWLDEFAKYGDKYMQEAGAAIQNKIGQFTSNPLIRNIIGQSKSSFDIRKIMDEKKILIMNLSKGRVGEQNASLLGSMLITKIYLGAMSRADADAETLRRLPNFYFYVDEFQSFSSDSFADILSEARKYKLNLTIAHQYVEQMSEVVQAAVFGNVGTMIVFRVGSFDAQIFEKEFAPQFVADDIVNLGQYQMYLRLMIDGVGSKPFSARGMAPIAAPAISYKKEIIDYSRAHNASPRAKIEEDIKSWHAPIAPPPRRDDAAAYRPAGAGVGAQSGSVAPLPRNPVPQGAVRTQSPLHQPFKEGFKQFSAPAKTAAPVSRIPAPTLFVRKDAPPANSSQPIPQKNSPALKDILTALEKDTEPIPARAPAPSHAPRPFQNPVRQNPPARPAQSAEPIQTARPPIASQIPKQESVSLDSLKPKIPQPHVQTKDARPETMSGLKALLSKVVTEHKQSGQEKKYSPAPSPRPAAHASSNAPKISPQNQSVRTPNPSSAETVSKKPKEVPEDVLRKILE